MRLLLLLLLLHLLLLLLLQLTGCPREGGETAGSAAGFGSEVSLHEKVFDTLVFGPDKP